MGRDEGVRRALAALELAGVRHRAAVRRRLRVSDEELTALLHLAHHDDVTPGRLPELTGLSRSGAGALAQRLERAGLVERRADLHDRRLRRLALSAAGRAAIERAYASLDDAAAAVLAGRPAGELERFEQLLQGLAAAAAAAGGHATRTERPPGEPAAAAGGAPRTERPPGEPIWRRWS